MNLEKREKQANIFQAILTSAAIIIGGLWALYTYFWSEHARHEAKLRDLRFIEAPSVEISTQLLELNGGLAHIVITLDVVNNSTCTMALEPKETYDEIVFAARATFDGGYQLGRPIYAHEGYIAQPTGVTGVLGSSILEPAAKDSFSYITPPIESGIYQISVYADVTLCGSKLGNFSLEESRYVVIP